MILDIRAYFLSGSPIPQPIVIMPTCSNCKKRKVVCISSMSRSYRALSSLSRSATGRLQPVVLVRVGAILQRPATTLRLVNPTLPQIYFLGETHVFLAGELHWSPSRPYRLIAIAPSQAEKEGSLLFIVLSFVESDWVSSRNATESALSVVLASLRRRRKDVYTMTTRPRVY